MFFPKTKNKKERQKDIIWKYSTVTMYMCVKEKENTKNTRVYDKRG